VGAKKLALRIGICAPSAAFLLDDAARVDALAAAHFPQITLEWHPQCFAQSGHFAGGDATRLAAFVELANRTDIDAIWFARGGYGAARIAGDAIPMLGDVARAKTYLGFSDAGNMLGALYAAGIGKPVHGPMAADIRRDGGEAAVLRALSWLASRVPSALDSALIGGTPYVAFNVMTLSMMVGTSLMPDLAGHVLMLEEVSEHLYAVDRALFHITTALRGLGLAGIKLGRVSDIPQNDRPFGATARECAEHWCSKNDIAFLGDADIGHDSDNKVVPFGIMPAH
jgi:muramoyltetrapeptide carboxypeptidase